MDPARKAGSQAVIRTTGWLVLLMLLLGGGGSAGEDGWGTVGALGRSCLLQGELWGQSSILSRRGCGRDHLLWAEGLWGEFLPGGKFFHPEQM